MVTVKNLMNSPDDLDAIEGSVRIAALGMITADFAPEYLTALRGLGYYEITEGAAPNVQPALDHDGDGRPGGVANSAPLTADEKIELLDAMTDEELRDFIKEQTGKAPHHKLGRAKLLAKARGE